MSDYVFCLDTGQERIEGQTHPSPIHVFLVQKIDTVHCTNFLVLYPYLLFPPTLVRIISLSRRRKDFSTN